MNNKRITRYCFLILVFSILFCAFFYRFAIAEELRSEYKILFDLLDNMLREIKVELVLNLSAQEELAQFKARWEAEVVNIGKKLDEMQDELKGSIGLLYEISQRRSALQSQQRQLLIRLKELNTQEFILKRHNKTLNDYLKITEGHLSRLKQELGKAGYGKQGFLEDPKQLAQGLSEATRQTQHLSRRYQALKADYDKFSGELTASGAEYSNIMKQKQKINSQLKEKQGAIEDINLKLNAGQEFVHKQKDAISNIEERSRKLDDYLKTYQEDINKNKEELSALNKELVNLKGQLEEQTKKLSAQIILKDEAVQLKNQKEQEIAKLNQRIDELTRQKDNEIAQLKDAKDKELIAATARLKEETDKLNAQLALNAQLGQLKSQKEEELRRQILVIAQKEEEIKKLNAVFTEYKARKEAEILALDRAIKRLQKELEDSDGLVRQLTQDKELLKTQQNQLFIKLKNTESQLDTLKQQNQKLNQQNVFLKDEYIKRSQESAELKKQNEDLIKERDRLVVSLKQAEKRMGELEAGQDALIEKNQGLEKEVINYQAKLKSRKENPVVKGKVVAEESNQAQKSCRELERKYKEAIEQNRYLKEKYSKLPKENAVLHYNLGVLYVQNRDYTRAIAEFQKVLEYNPDDSEAHYNLGVVYSEYLNDRKKALEHFKKYLSLSPEDSEAERIRKYIVTWETLEQEQNE